MQKKQMRFRIGWRTLKTAAAVIIAMIIAELLGNSGSKLIFAMLGAMAAVQPTFKESIESCLTQIIGVLFGAVIGVILLSLSLPPLVATGIGIILVITLYNALRMQFSPSLPCFMVVMICTTADIQPFAYAGGRIWDTAIGLIVGLLINTLVFPYDNSRQIRSMIESIDKELLVCLEEMFDGDEILPRTDEMFKRIDAMAAQLKIFSNQKLFFRLRRQKEELEIFKQCEENARELLAHMEVLCHMEHLSGDEEQESVVHYHVRQIRKLREALLENLQKLRK